MVQMRGCKTVETTHEPQKVAQASCLFGTDRLEACPTLQPAPRFIAPMRVEQLEIRAAHERAFPVRRPCRQNAEWSGPCRFISVKVSRRETKRRVQGGVPAAAGLGCSPDTD